MTDVSAGFRAPCWCPSRWALTWRLHTNLYKFGENVSPHIFHKNNCCDLNLGEGLCISTFFLFPDSGLNLLNGFDFLFWSILNGVTLKTSNYVTERQNYSRRSVYTRGDVTGKCVTDQLQNRESFNPTRHLMPSKFFIASFPSYVLLSIYSFCFFPGVNSVMYVLHDTVTCSCIIISGI